MQTLQEEMLKKINQTLINNDISNYIVDERAIVILTEIKKMNTIRP